VIKKSCGADRVSHDAGVAGMTENVEAVIELNETELEVIQVVT
jgi:hypothetical protein